MGAIASDGTGVLTYSNVGKSPKKTPVKVLTVVNKPAVQCPFTESYATLDRCRKCNNYKGFTNKGKSIKCKWPY